MGRRATCERYDHSEKWTEEENPAKTSGNGVFEGRLQVILSATPSLPQAQPVPAVSLGSLPILRLRFFQALLSRLLPVALGVERRRRRVLVASPQRYRIGEAPVELGDGVPELGISASRNFNAFMTVYGRSYFLRKPVFLGSGR